MGFRDILDTAADTLSNVKDTVVDISGNVSTTLYTKANDVKTNITEKKTGQAKAKQESSQNANQLNNMLDALKGGSFSEQSTESLTAPKEKVSLKEALGSDVKNTSTSYRELPQDEFNDTKMHDSQYTGTAIKRWTETPFKEAHNSKASISTINVDEQKNMLVRKKLQKQNIQDQPFRIDVSQEKTKQLGLIFDRYNNKYNASPYAKQTIDTALNAFILKNIFGSLNGDINSLSELDKECNLSSKKSEKMLNVVMDCLYNRISTEKAAQYMFLAVHNVDIDNLSGALLPEYKALNLALLKDQCPGVDVTYYEELSQQQIGLLVSALYDKSLNFNNIDFTSNYYLQGCIDQTRNNKDMELLDLSIKNDHSISLMFEYSKKTDCVKINKIDFNKFDTMAVMNADNECIQGDYDEVLDLFKSNDNLINLARTSTMTSLDNILSKSRSQTTQEALENKMTDAEKQQYEQEYNEAMNQLFQQGINKPIGFAG